MVMVMVMVLTVTRSSECLSIRNDVYFNSHLVFLLSKAIIKKHVEHIVQPYIAQSIMRQEAMEYEKCL